MIGKIALIVALTALVVASMPNRLDGGKFNQKKRESIDYEIIPLY